MVMGFVMVGVVEMNVFVVWIEDIMFIVCFMDELFVVVVFVDLEYDIFEDFVEDIVDNG